jgi:hypothetical protein
MTNETEQLRRLVEAREMATKGDWIKSEFDYTVFGGDGFHVCDPGQGPHFSKKWNDDVHTEGIPYRHWGEGPGKDYIERECDDLESNQSFITIAGSTDLRAVLTRMEKMEEALRFYADTENHTIHIIDEVPYHYVDDDGGQRAREALE